MGEKIQGIQNRQGEVKNNTGNGESKELICMTHGRELRWGNDGRRAGIWWRGIKGRKKWDNCNSIINKIYYNIKRANEAERYRGQIIMRDDTCISSPEPMLLLLYCLHGKTEPYWLLFFCLELKWPSSQY